MAIYWRFRAANIPPELKRIPGLRVGQSTVMAPWNARGVVVRLLDNVVASPPPTPLSLGSSPSLAAPYLHPQVREPGFLMSYQKIGPWTVLQYPRESGHLHWSAGCLTGRTKILINRGGKAASFALSVVVSRLLGEESPRIGTKRLYGWDLSTPTYAQSVDEEGYVRLNEVTRVFRNGVAEVYELTTAAGRTVEATAAHRFMLAAGGFARLGDLHVGDMILGVTWPKATRTIRKSHYRLVEQMWNHPHALIRDSARADRTGRRRQATVPEHRLVYEAHLNGTSLPEFVGRIVLNRLGPAQRAHRIEPRVFPEL